MGKTAENGGKKHAAVNIIEPNLISILNVWKSRNFSQALKNPKRTKTNRIKTRVKCELFPKT